MLSVQGCFSLNISVYSSSGKHECKVDLYPKNLTLTGVADEVKSVGRVCLQQTETRSSQRIDKARADHESKVKRRPPRTSSTSVSSSKKDRVQENYQQHLLPVVQEDSWITCKQTEQILNPSVNDTVTESGKSSMDVRERRAPKVHTTPVCSTRTEYDIVTPKKEDVGVLQDAGAARCGSMAPAVVGPRSPHSSQKGKLIYTGLAGLISMLEMFLLVKAEQYLTIDRKICLAFFSRVLQKFNKKHNLTMLAWKKNPGNFLSSVVHIRM